MNWVDLHNTTELVNLKYIYLVEIQMIMKDSRKINLEALCFLNGKDFIFDQNKMKYVFIGKNYKVSKMVENSQSFKSITLCFPLMETIMNKGKYLLFAMDIAKSI